MSDRPDWYNAASLIGNYNGNYIPVLVDSDGNIIAHLKGQYDSDLKTVALDSDGRIVSVIRDPVNDRYVAVDSDGRLTTEIKGQYGSDLKTISLDSAGRIVSVIRDPDSDQYLAVDADGHLVAEIKGDYSGALKTLQVDDNGLIKVNVSVQDLDQMKTVQSIPEAGILRRARGRIAGTGDVIYTVPSGYKFWLAYYAITVLGAGSTPYQVWAILRNREGTTWMSLCNTRASANNPLAFGVSLSLYFPCPDGFDFQIYSENAGQYIDLSIFGYEIPD